MKGIKFHSHLFGEEFCSLCFEPDPTPVHCIVKFNNQSYEYWYNFSKPYCQIVHDIGMSIPIVTINANPRKCNISSNQSIGGRYVSANNQNVIPHQTNPLCLENQKGTDCFVNVCVNSLLALKHVQDLLNSDEQHPILTELRNLSNDPSPIKTTNKIRMLVSQQYPEYKYHQQDAALFMQCLISMCPQLELLFQFNNKTTFHCKACNAVTDNDNSEVFTCLQIYDLKFNTFREMIDINIQDMSEDFRGCPTLHHGNVKGTIPTKHTRIQKYMLSSKILMIKTNIFEAAAVDGQYGKIMKPIIPDNQIDYDQNKYQLRCIISHLGDEKGHFVVDLQNTDGQYIRCSDKDVRRISKPSKYGYIFIYELMS